MRGNLCQCGNVKSRTARTCRSCYDLLRTIRADEHAAEAQSLCPTCGQPKTPESRQCQACYLAQLRSNNERREEREHDACPSCGGRKMKRSQLCWECHKKNQRLRLEKLWEERKREAEWKDKYMRPVWESSAKARRLQPVVRGSWWGS